MVSVYDNYQVDPKLETAWGFGCIIKASGPPVLFDTGGDSEILLSNMKKMGIDPKRINTVIISHIHADHAGGLNGFLRENNGVTVFIPHSFPNSIREMIARQKAKFVDVCGSTRISEFLFSTGELYGPPEEQALVVRSRKGLIIITGCAHPGVVNIVEKSKEMFPSEDVYLVVGGFHHPPISVVEKFRELGVRKVAPSHCTGDAVREAFRKEYNENFIDYGVGRVIKIE